MVRGIFMTSGGKDSILALHIAIETGIEPAGILVMVPEDPESMLYHTHNLHLMPLISEALEIEHFVFKARRGEELEELARALASMDADLLVTGGIRSEYQRRAFGLACKSAGMRLVSPLWGMDPRSIYGELLKRGIDAVVVGVAALGLGYGWLGRHLDREAVNELLSLAERYHFDPVGEGGDLDTLVLDAPLYTKRLRILGSRRVWEGDRGSLIIDEAVLEGK